MLNDKQLTQFCILRAGVRSFYHLVCKYSNRKKWYYIVQKDKIIT